MKTIMQSAVQLTEKLHRMPSGQPGEIWSVEGDLRLGVNLADWDRLGCLLKKLEMKPMRGHSLEIDPECAADTITYLGEKLEVIEAEEACGRAVLRSAPPRREKEQISFFEMVLDRAKGMSLVRYVYDRLRGERSQVPASLTRETLDRLLKDLITLAREKPEGSA